MHIDAMGAVGAYLSHVKCWQWLCDRPDDDPPWALIVEDDVCFGADFSATFRSIVVPRLLQRPDVDFCILGYRGTDISVPAHETDVGGVRVYDRFSFEGAHCYAVTRPGAQRLLSIAFPIQLHVELWMGITMELSLTRGYVWPDVLATQCMGWVEQRIGHYDWGVGVKKMLPDISVHQAAEYAAVVGCLIFVILLIHFRRKNNDHSH